MGFDKLSPNGFTWRGVFASFASSREPNRKVVKRTAG